MSNNDVQVIEATPTAPAENARVAAAALRDRFGIARIDIGLVLGSGWKSGVDEVGTPIGECELDELPGFLPHAVAGHGGRLVLVRTPRDRVAAILTGRTHFYEGRGVAAVVHGVRTLAAAGADTLVLTNGCGGLDLDIAPGTPVLLRDHINMTGASPIVGANFVDLTEAYSPRLRDLARSVDPTLTEGVYIQFHGPEYETPAEVKMAGILGGTLVGMSTTLERSRPARPAWRCSASPWLPIWRPASRRPRCTTKRCLRPARVPPPGSPRSSRGCSPSSEAWTSPRPLRGRCGQQGRVLRGLPPAWWRAPLSFDKTRSFLGQPAARTLGSAQVATGAGVGTRQGPRRMREPARGA